MYLNNIQDYQVIGQQIRQMIIDNKPIPPDYQDLIEQFIPTEDKFPDRRVIPVYEFPNSNPKNFLENKRGYRLQYMFVFITKSLAQEFCQKLGDNYALLWQCARFMIESCDNLVFVKTRGQKRRSFLLKMEKGQLPLPFCSFFFDMKQKEILDYLDKGQWSIRIVWGPAMEMPLYGAQVEDQNQELLKEEIKQETKVIKKQEIKAQEEDIIMEPIKKIIKIAAPKQSINYFMELGKKNAEQLIKNNIY